MKELNELADTYDDAFDLIRAQVEDLRRELSAVMMADFPDRDFLMEQAQNLQISMGADEVQINILLHDKQITIVSHPNGPAVSVSADIRDSLCTLTVGNDESLAISDISNDPFMAAHVGKDSWGAWASAPIKVAGQTAGSVCALDGNPRLWTAYDEKKLERVAILITEAVDEWSRNLPDNRLK